MTKRELETVVRTYLKKKTILLIVPTRAVGTDGFSKKKDIEHNDRRYIKIWREDWALTQNRAYERNRLDIRVSHERLEKQRILEREPVNHLSLADWQKE